MLHLVIAHYNNSLNWITKLQKYNKFLNIIIYSKNENPPSHIHNVKVIKRPNAGREGETYIYHIIKAYSFIKEDDYTLFCQDDPFEHQPNFLLLISFLVKIYELKKQLPNLLPLNSHAYQDVKKDMPNYDKVIMGDIFSYEEYKQKKEYYKQKGKTFMNSFPPKKANIIKTHSIFYKKKQIAQVNIDFLNLDLVSLQIPDSNPFIWHLYKGINGYLANSTHKLTDELHPITLYLALFYNKDGIVPSKYLDRLAATVIPYNPAAQFLISNKLILQNDLFVYQNIHNVLLDPHQPILSQKVRLNGFMLEFLWLHIFYFDKYYKNYFSPKKLQFYKLRNSISKDIKYYRLMVINELKKKINNVKYETITMCDINKTINIAQLIIKYYPNESIANKMNQMIKENNEMKKSSQYTKYYKRL